MSLRDLRRCALAAVANMEHEDERLEAAARIVARAGIIHVTGVGKSGIAAEKIAATLRAHGMQAFYLDPMTALHGDLGGVRLDDTIIAISASGKTQEVRALLDHVPGFDVSLTVDDQSPIGSVSRVVVRTLDPDWDLPTARVPSASFISACLAGDAIGILAANIRGGSQISKTHPGGAIGGVV